MTHFQVFSNEWGEMIIGILKFLNFRELLSTSGSKYIVPPCNYITGGLAQRSEPKSPNYLSKNSNIEKCQNP